MICGKCGSLKTAVLKSLVVQGETTRVRECPCGVRFVTTEKLSRWLPAVAGNPAGNSTARPADLPAAVNRPPQPRGVGGVLSSGSDLSLFPARIGSLEASGSEVVRKIRSAQPVPSAAFEDFWSVYPRKVAKAAAGRAWVVQGCDRVIDAVRDGISAQLPFFRAQPLDKVPHPASWINARRWTDDPAAYRFSRSALPAAMRDFTIGHVRAEDCDHTAEGLQKL